jgi:hypothetical protein
MYFAGAMRCVVPGGSGHTASIDISEILCLHGTCSVVQYGADNNSSGAVGREPHGTPPSELHSATMRPHIIDEEGRR